MISVFLLFHYYNVSFFIDYSKCQQTHTVRYMYQKVNNVLVRTLVKITNLEGVESFLKEYKNNL